MAGKEIEFDIEPTDTVKRIKERVEEKEGIPPPQQVRRFKPPAAGCRDNVSGGSTCSLLFLLRCQSAAAAAVLFCWGICPRLQALDPAAGWGCFFAFASCFNQANQSRTSCEKSRA